MNPRPLSALANTAPSTFAKKSVFTGNPPVKEGLVPNPKGRLKEQFHEVCRFKHVAMRTEESYWGWVVRLVRHFGSKIHPRDLTADQLREFLSYLATAKQVAVSTQNQALKRGKTSAGDIHDDLSTRYPGRTSPKTTQPAGK